ncbi:MAG: DUF5807 family protein [Natronomonas sp.]
MSDGDPRVTYESFLEGGRPDHVGIFLHESAVDSVETFVDRDLGVRLETGVVLVLPGPAGRKLFHRATGLEAMTFAGGAMKTEGVIVNDLTGGSCPDASGDGNADENDGSRTDHEAKFIFAFVEAENEDAGGIYADGPVLHAYAACECGTTYSDRWVVAE